MGWAVAGCGWSLPASWPDPNSLRQLNPDHDERYRGDGIPARALLCFMSRLATSEVGHGERSDKAAPDRTLLGPQGPAPNLEGRRSAAGDHAACALRNTGGRGGLRRSPALGCEEPGLPAPVFTVQRWPSLP